MASLKERHAARKGGPHPAAGPITEGGPCVKLKPKKKTGAARRTEYKAAHGDTEPSCRAYLEQLTFGRDPAKGRKRKAKTEVKRLKKEKDQREDKKLYDKARNKARKEKQAAARAAVD